MKTQFKINGLTCAACEKLSAKRLAKINGVTGVQVSRDSGVADIEADRPITLTEASAALSGTDYRAAALH
ncbi:MAG: heavy-metal-associated domain-containing protein [Patescibacteria group bacterium]